MNNNPNRPTWRSVLQGPDWTRVDHGRYQHRDGRVVVSHGGGEFSRYNSDGVRVGPALRTELWSEISDWATVMPTPRRETPRALRRL